MNKVFMLVAVFCTLISYSQIGVNVPVPLEPFHVDGSKNNLIGVKPSVEQAKDDFVVTKEGKVGIGIYEPQANLDVNGSLRMVDGTEGANKVMMSNAAGNLKWESIPYIVPTVLGEFEDGRATSSDAGQYAYSKGYIVLTKGRWVVNAGLTLTTGSDQNMWLHAILSSEKTDKRQDGFRFNGGAGQNTAYASRIIGSNDYDYLSGSSVIEVTADRATIYLLIAKTGSWSFAPTSWENYFYAIPIY
ncbi:MAG: hypothetical protein LBI73_03075 [Myroides sp.]|jgi:hypothetical protein|nr:hypothetical protein [Myroides sp.]